MFEVTAGAAPTTTDEVTSPLPQPKKRASVKSVPFGTLHVRFAKVKGIDTTRAGKLNRSFMRSNYETLVKVWPELRASHKVNRDGNRWPATLPSNVADAIIKRDAAALQAMAKRKRS